MKNIGLVVSLVVSLVWSAKVQAQTPVTLERTEQRLITAANNGVTYKLYIALPEHYGEPGRRFPVAYLLDADYSFAIARNIVDHLAARNDLPEIILVGIAYTGPPAYQLNRSRDYTPTHVADDGNIPERGYGAETRDVSGGGPRFREFIERELVPFIDSSYATVLGDRCIVGHSYGGLFGAWTLVTRPALFRRYILVSPSLWYDHQLVLRQVSAMATGRDSSPARVYVVAGDHEVNAMVDMRADVQRFADQLRRGNRPGLVVRSSVFDNETHNSLVPRALSNGLRFVFEGRE
jgi:uncharacterized protein